MKNKEIVEGVRDLRAAFKRIYHGIAGKREFKGSISISIDGTRRSLVRGLNDIRRAVDAHDTPYGIDYNELHEAFDGLAQTVNVFMCCFDNTDKDDFNDLSDDGKLSVEYFGVNE